MSKEYLSMSDEDFLKEMPASGSDNPVETPDNPEDNQAVNTETPVVETPPVETPNEPEPEPEATVIPEPNPLALADDAVTKPADKPVEEPKTEENPPKAEKPEASGSDAEKPKADAEPTVEAPDYKAFYERVIGKPIKANGKEIVLKTPEEVERMIQMGAGYGRKIQDIQPHIKTLRMLEKNNLLDENALSRLIDIHNKNPEAIKSLIKESGIDPLEINPEDKVDYVPTNHSVSDEEVRFQEALDEVLTSPAGLQTVQVINQTWDDQSKKALWDHPELLGVFQSQRDNGVYDAIVAEIDRQKMLGMIPQHTPFIQAYRMAGDTLYPPQPTQAAPTPTPTPPEPAQPKVIATRVETPKAPVTNDAKAQAASPTQTSSRKATTFVNPLEMADEDFLKTFKGRI